MVAYHTSNRLVTRSRVIITFFEPDTLLTANSLNTVSQLVPERAFFPNKRPGHELGDGRED